jgi:hypothetical protein
VLATDRLVWGLDGVTVKARQLGQWTRILAKCGEIPQYRLTYA